MREFLFDGSSDLQSSGTQLLIEIFTECVLARTRKSLEHMKRFVELLHAEVFSSRAMTEDEA